MPDRIPELDQDTLKQMSNEELALLLAGHGLDVNSGPKNEAKNARVTRALEVYRARRQASRNVLVRWLQRLTQFSGERLVFAVRGTMQAGGEALYSAGQAFFQHWGRPLTLLALFVVEFLSVWAAIALIDLFGNTGTFSAEALAGQAVNEAVLDNAIATIHALYTAIAPILSFALVMFYFATAYEYNEQAAQWRLAAAAHPVPAAHDPTATPRFSLRLLWRDLRYLVGWTAGGWQAEYDDAFGRMRGKMRGIMLAVAFLGAAGRVGLVTLLLPIGQFGWSYVQAQPVIWLAMLLAGPGLSILLLNATRNAMHTFYTNYRALDETLTRRRENRALLVIDPEELKEARRAEHLFLLLEVSRLAQRGELRIIAPPTLVPPLPASTPSTPPSMPSSTNSAAPHGTESTTPLADLTLPLPDETPTEEVKVGEQRQNRL